MARQYSHKKKKSKILADMIQSGRYRTPLKRSMTGYEVELCLVDEHGAVSHDSEKILKDCKASSKNFPVSREVGKNMIEVAALPSAEIHRTALYFLDNIHKVLGFCEDHNLHVLPLGTHPGSFTERVWPKDRYVYPAKALGKRKYNYVYTHCYGFHYHYTLPRGTFDKKNKFLKKQSYSKLQKTLLDSYNFMIAIDPIITALSQSSPFEANRYTAKDTRLLYLRGGKRLKFKGLYDQAQMLGCLQPYKQTLTDLAATLRKKDAKFRSMLRGAGAPQSFIAGKAPLDFIWNPVKINQLGTLEHRAPDTNYPSLLLGISVMIKYVLRAIQQEFYNVVPSDIGITEPFKLEGDTIFIPPHTVVRNRWQYNSVYHGLANKEIRDACTRFYALARKLVFMEYVPALKPIRRTLLSGRTLSDHIISYVKRRGYGIEDKIPADVCNAVALLHGKRMLKDVEQAQKVYEKLGA